MGRGLSVTARAAALALAVLVLQPVGDAALAATGSHVLVLVGGKASRLSPLSPTEVRRLYLGKSVEKGGIRVMPLRNATDPLLYETFLQKVMFMSARSYERYLLVQVYQSGGRRPPDYDKLSELEDALQRDPGRVTFMWRGDAEAMPDVTIIQDLSQESAP